MTFFIKTKNIENILKIMQLFSTTIVLNSFTATGVVEIIGLIFPITPDIIRFSFLESGITFDFHFLNCFQSVTSLTNIEIVSKTISVDCPSSFVKRQ